jgi:hypothetical protein
MEWTVREMRDWRTRRYRHSMACQVLSIAWCNRNEKERECQEAGD